MSSNSSGDESQEGEDCKDPVTSPPAKTSSSSTSTSKTSSPLGSLTLLSLPNKPKQTSRPRQQNKKRTTPPLMKTPPLSTNISSDSFASNQVALFYIMLIEVLNIKYCVRKQAWKVVSALILKKNQNQSKMNFKK